MNLKEPTELPLKLYVTIYAKDALGKTKRLGLHTSKDYDAVDNIFLDYVDFIKKGETIWTKVEKFLKEDYGIENVIDMELIETPKEETFDHEKEVFDYDLFVLVKFDEGAAKKIGDVYASWIEVDMI